MDSLLWAEVKNTSDSLELSLSYLNNPDTPYFTFTRITDHDSSVYFVEYGAMGSKGPGMIDYYHHLTKRAKLTPESRKLMAEKHRSHQKVEFPEDTWLGKDRNMLLDYRSMKLDEFKTKYQLNDAELLRLVSTIDLEIRLNPAGGR